jgi:hypothetical protein
LGITVFDPLVERNRMMARVCRHLECGLRTWVRAVLVGACATGICAGCHTKPSAPEAVAVVHDLVDLFLGGTAETSVPDRADGSPGQAPHANPERHALFVPFGAQVTFELELPAGCVLTTRDTKMRGSAVGRLEVEWVPRRRHARSLTHDLSAEEQRRAVFANRRGETGRLTLKAVLAADGEGVRDAGMVLLDPRVVTGGGGRHKAEHRSRRRRDARPNIVVYLVDALRADHLGCYGYGRPTSPCTDRFAEGAVLFENALAQSSWTRPSVASLFTGLLPQQHRTLGKQDVLPDDAKTVAELLADSGYSTAPMAIFASFSVLRRGLATSSTWIK